MSTQSEFEAAKKSQRELEEVLDKAADALRQIPGVGTGPLGLTPDHVKESALYRNAQHQYDLAFGRLRNFNAWFTKTFKKELVEERKARMANGTYANGR